MPVNEDGTATGGGYEDRIKHATSLEEMKNEDGTYGKLHSTQREVDMFLQALTRTNELVSEEVMRQLGKWGVQDHPSFHLVAATQQTMLKVVDVHHLIPLEDVAKDRCEENFRNGTGSWCDILVEELAEALGAAYRNTDATGYEHHVEGDDECPDYCADVIQEVVQVVAVGVSWITNIIWQNNKEALAEYFREQDEAMARRKAQYVQKLKEWGIDLSEAVFDEEGGFEWGTIHVSRETAELAQKSMHQAMRGVIGARQQLPQHLQDAIDRRAQGGYI